MFDSPPAREQADAATPGRPRVLAVINQKGGVGKTTTVLGLAGALADAERRVLVVDMDAQANSSQTLLPNYQELVGRADFFTVNEVMEQSARAEDTPEAITATAWPGVDLIPSEQNLANREREGTTAIENRLRRALRGVPAGVYDAILVDCPPSLGTLTVNALTAADEVLLVCTPDSYSVSAIDQFQVTLQTIRDSYDHDIRVHGIVINLFEHTNTSKTHTEAMKKRFGENILLVFPRRTVLSKASGFNLSMFASLNQGNPFAGQLNKSDTAFAASQYRLLAARIGLLPVPVAATAVKAGA